MLTPILSIETILSAMMCLCSGNGTSSDIYTQLAGHINGHNTRPPILMSQPDELRFISEKLNRIDEQLAEVKVQEAEILAKLQKYQSEAPQIRLGLTPLDQCPGTTESSSRGIYTLKLRNYADPFQVLCNGNDDNGAGWLVIMQRYDGSENFFRTWQEYRQGFGLLNGEFFIGLDKLHALTAAKPQELLIVLEDFEKERRFAKFDSFELGSENEGYSLKVLGDYSGTAGDSFRHHYSQKFTTFDHDNDQAGGNCAQDYTGAWWYVNCHVSNLFGQYLGGKVPEGKTAKGMSWDTFRGLDYSLKSVKMMIRTRK